MVPFKSGRGTFIHNPKQMSSVDNSTISLVIGNKYYWVRNSGSAEKYRSHTDFYGEVWLELDGWFSW